MFSSIYLFNFRIFALIFYENLRHFSFRRLIFCLLFFLLVLLIGVLTLTLRLLDEIIFIGYRKTEIKDPVFILSTPRSGTTLLHRLMSLDKERFTYFLLYHNFIPSICYYKFILLMKRLDRGLGMSLKRFWDKIEKWAFRGWKEIHPMGFELSEEDEGLFTLIMNSPACGMFCPWFLSFSNQTIGDRLPQRRRNRLMNYYLSTLKRFSYGWGKKKNLLVKNVMSSGRIKMIIEKIPDAKVIMILRHPYKTIPSITSMFSKPWGMIAPELPHNSKEYRTWGDLNIEFYKCMLEASRTLPAKQLFIIDYDELVHDPVAMVHRIYDHFGMKESRAFERRLRMQERVTKKYSSHHAYSLEEYGYNREEIAEKLEEVFQEFGFEVYPEKKVSLPSSAP